MMITKENVLKAIENIKHPAIDLSLVELGIVKHIDIEKDTVQITFALPFPNIPIVDMLINMIKQPIIALGVKFEETIVLMTEEEKQKFLALEESAWKGM